MTETAFEAGLAARTADMIDACTRCGKCAEICPVTKQAGVGNAAPQAVIDKLKSAAATENPDPDEA